MTTANQILAAAAGHMLDRAATYDRPAGERSMTATVQAFNAMTGHCMSTEQGWLFMIALKAVRSQQGAYKADNYEDLAAYAALQGECAALDRLEPASEWPDDDARIDAIAQNGNTGEHYGRPVDGWHNAPEWAQWMAMDADGMWFFHPEQPYMTAGRWANSRALYQYAGIVNPVQAWQETAQQRPEK